jgi:hypothetical protein
MIGNRGVLRRFLAARLAITASLTFVACLVVAAAAGAAVTIGQTNGPFTTCDSGYDWVAETTPSGNSYVVPTVDGVSAWTVTSWATNGGGQTGDQLEMKIFRKVSEPETYQVIGHSGPETLSTPDKNTFPASVPARAGDLLGFHTGTDNQKCSIQPVPGASIDYFLGDLADGASASFSVDTGYLLNIEATLEPDNRFTLAGLTRNKKRGTATETVMLPNPGTLTLLGSGVKPASARTAMSVPAAGQVPVPIRARGKKKKTLKSTGKVKLTVTITYTPNDGTASAQALKVKLKKKI